MKIYKLCIEGNRNASFYNVPELNPMYFTSETMAEDALVSMLCELLLNAKTKKKQSKVLTFETFDKFKKCSSIHDINQVLKDFGKQLEFYDDIGFNINGFDYSMFFGYRSYYGKTYSCNPTAWKIQEHETDVIPSLKLK